MQNSCPVFFLLSPPCCLLVFLSHLSICSLTTCPFFHSLRCTLPPSVLPLCSDMNWCVRWVDHSLQLLSANYNSLSLMCHCGSFSIPLCLSLSLSLPLPLPFFTLSCLLPSLSLPHPFPPIFAPTLSFFSLWDGPVMKIRLLVHKQSDVVPSACVHVLCNMLTTHLNLRAWDTRKEGRESLPLRH